MRAIRKQRPTFTRSLTIAFATMVAAGAGCDCGDNLDDGNVDGDAGEVDATESDASVDAAMCTAATPGDVGGACSDDAACVGAPVDGGPLTPFCLNDTLPEAWPTEGFCTITDLTGNTSGCMVDADCGDGNTCAQLPNPPFGSFGACMPKCCDEVSEGDACTGDRICANSLFGESIMTEACVPGTLQAPDGAECTTFADCDRDSVCRSDRFQFPGGQCSRTNCGGDEDCAPGGDGRCVDLQDTVAPLCVDDCDTDADCRTDQGYRCIDRGGVIGKFCQHPGPGDSCTADSDCGVPDQPSADEQWACREGAAYPGGYCTVEDCDPNDNDTCPIFSFCVGLGGEADTFCADECATPGGTDCGTGYQCVTVNIGGGTRDVCIPDGETVDEPAQN